jgi:hypothetical protein
VDPVAPWTWERTLRNNNPGDLRPRGQAPEWPGQDVPDDGAGGPFATFITASEGWCGLGLWCLDARYLRGLKTVEQMISAFSAAPVSEIASSSAELDLSDYGTLESLCRAITGCIGSDARWPDVVIASGLRLCRAHWPAFRAARLAPAELPLAQEPNNAGPD